VIRPLRPEDAELAALYRANREFLAVWHDFFLFQRLAD
jgi:hypothetical protein